MPRPIVMKSINSLTLLVVIALNGLAATGAMSGDNIGEIANRYQSLFLPANWVFGIWSLIYSGLIAGAVYQWLPLEGARRAVQRLGWWWVIAGVLNVAWITLFSFGRYALALLVMIVFLVSLIAATEGLRAAPYAPAWHERLCAIWPFDLYLAWISVAVISNTFQFAHVVGFGGFGISETAWSIAMMTIASALGAWMAWARGMWVFPLVVAWAIYGIGARYAAMPVMAEATRILLIAGPTVGLIAWIAGRRGPRTR